MAIEDPPSASGALLEAVHSRAQDRLLRNLSTVRAELLGTGAGGAFVRRHPLLSVVGAAAAGAGAGLGARGVLSAAGRLLAAPASLRLLFGSRTARRIAAWRRAHAP